MEFVKTTSQLPAHRQEVLVIYKGKLHYAAYRAHDEQTPIQMRNFFGVVTGTITIVPASEISQWVPFDGVESVIRSFASMRNNHTKNVEDARRLIDNDARLNSVINGLNFKISGLQNMIKDYVNTVSNKEHENNALRTQNSEILKEYKEHKKNNCSFFCWLKGLFNRS